MRRAASVTFPLQLFLHLDYDETRIIEVGRMAEDIVGHQLPGELIHAGSLDAFRRSAAG